MLRISELHHHVKRFVTSLGTLKYSSTVAASLQSVGSGRGLGERRGGDGERLGGGLERLGDEPRLPAVAGLRRHHLRLPGLTRAVNASWMPEFKLLEIHDTSLFPSFVLGCINTDFSIQIRILQHFSKSTKLSS